jgi:hypothetical protein
MKVTQVLMGQKFLRAVNRKAKDRRSARATPTSALLHVCD